MKVLVTDGNTRPGLAITRSLGKAGHKVVVGHHKNRSLAGYSKYASSQCCYPDPISQPNEFINFLLKFTQENNVDAIFPVTDITTIPISREKSEFEKYCKVPCADYEIIDKAANKADIINLAKSLQLDVPKSIIINSVGDLDTIRNIDLGYPLVIKPSRSRILTDSGWILTSVTYAADERDLHQQLQCYQDEIFPIILQERITGPGLGIFMCFNKGQPVAAFSHQRIREKPPSGGVSVLSKSVELDPCAYEFSTKLLSSLQWQGVAMVEYKMDEKDGRPKLMEINGRFWGSLQLAIDSGVDFPMILARTLDRDFIESIKDYQIGVKTRWLWGDVDALLIRLIKDTKRQQLPEGADSKLLYFLKFLKLWEKNLHYEVLRVSDLKPWLYESYQWLIKLFR
ncbi:MAG: ATP-grasp domain-containing protein [Gammaproteobacteria bacterium]|nr:ATP-grasp domain-containing protein [Gammaproteobacteria bacterium]